MLFLNHIIMDYISQYTLLNFLNLVIQYFVHDSLIFKIHIQICNSYSPYFT